MTRVTESELKTFIERYERLEAEKTDINDQQKEVMAEAKSTGYDTKALKHLVKLRKMDPDDLENQEAIIELYRETIGV